MNSQLTQSIPQIVFWLLIASVVGAGTYLFWRKVESKYPFAIPVSVALAGSPFILIYAVFSFSFGLKIFLSTSLIYSIGFLFCIFGGICHKKIADSPETMLSPFLTLLLSVFSSLFIGYSFDLPRITHYPIKTPDVIYFWSFVLSPSVTPILIWAWHNMKLRPGIDKPLSD